MAERLVIGVGNDLRRDDGVGRLVADSIDRLGLPGVEVACVSQLVPELVERMAAAGRVVVVDADIDVEVVTVRTAVADGPPHMTHHGSAESLLALAATIGLAMPPVQVVGVPAEDFGMGEGLGPVAARSVGSAVDIVRGILAIDPLTC